MVYRGCTIAVTAELSLAGTWDCAYRIVDVRDNRVLHNGTCGGGFNQQSRAEAVAMQLAMFWVDVNVIPGLNDD